MKKNENLNQLLGILSILSLLAISCETKLSKNNNQVLPLPKSYNFPFLVDSFDFKTTIKAQPEFGVATYHPFYFGAKGDTILINYKLPQYSIPPPPPPSISQNITVDSLIKTTNPISYKAESYYYNEYSDYFQEIPSGQYVPWDSAKIEIEVDTSNFIRNIDFSEFQDSTFAFKAYPVIIENQTNQEVSIGYGSHIALILEAKDKNGRWQPIEKQYMYSCGMGLPTILLPPDEMTLTSVPIYKGDFNTDFRLKLGKNYSDTFKGTVDLRQFEN